MNYKVVIVFVLATMAFGISNYARANMNKPDHSQSIQTLRQASDELKGTNPMLADKLSNYADKYAEWSDKRNERWQQKQDDAGNLRAAAAELQATRKDIADGLNEMAERYVQKPPQNADSSGKL